MKYLFLLVLLVGCGPSENASIEVGVNNSSINKYKIGAVGKIVEFETTYGVRCVAYGSGYKSAALSCDWVGRQ